MAEHEEEMKRLSKLPENKLCANCDAEARCVARARARSRMRGGGAGGGGGGGGAPPRS